jgi:HSP20 family molecular chaperone IbpA
MPLPSGRQRARTAPVNREWSPEVNVSDDDKYVLIFESKLAGVRDVSKNIRVQSDDRTLTIKGTRPDPEATEKDFRGYSVLDANGIERVVVGPPMQSFERSFALPSKVDARKGVAFFSYKDEVLIVRIPKTDLPANTEVSAETAGERNRRALSALTGRHIPFGDEADRTPISIDFLSHDSASIPVPVIHTHGGQMVEDDYALQLGRILAQKAITKAGNRYFPLSLAAPLAQAPETTLRDWISKKTKFAGKTIQTHTSPTAGIYISEESVARMANRFVKWPSQQPAGRVTLGETDNQSGYIGLTDAARMVGVERHTIWRWATKGTSPTEDALDVIKCPASEQFYISEKDVESLKSVVPRSGLRRGPRSQLIP